MDVLEQSKHTCQENWALDLNPRAYKESSGRQPSPMKDSQHPFEHLHLDPEQHDMGLNTR